MIATLFSEMPVILSLEDHCNRFQQQFQNILPVEYLQNWVWNVYDIEVLFKYVTHGIQKPAAEDGYLLWRDSWRHAVEGEVLENMFGNIHRQIWKPQDW